MSNDSMKKTVLIVCIHNSARSQMAEEFFKNYAGDLFIAESAGIEPGTLNPFVVEALQDEGIDISGKKTRSALALYNAGKSYHYVITVCDPEAAEKCPLFPGTEKRMHWPFKDPSSFSGNHDERLAGTKVVMREIKAKVSTFIADYRRDPSAALEKH